jgi:hypothetical protein
MVDSVAVEGGGDTASAGAAAAAAAPHPEALNAESSL